MARGYNPPPWTIYRVEEKETLQKNRLTGFYTLSKTEPTTLPQPPQPPQPQQPQFAIGTELQPAEGSPSCPWAPSCIVMPFHTFPNVFMLSSPCISILTGVYKCFGLG